jgi:putative endonuclease
MATSYVYIVTNKPHGTLYVGITSNLVQRIYQHKQGTIDSFTKKYKLTKLVYYEIHDSIYSAITREKSMKRWLRKWKIAIVERRNKDWQDLYYYIMNNTIV